MRYFIIPQDESKPVIEKSVIPTTNDTSPMLEQFKLDIGAQYLESVRPRLIQDLVRQGEVDKIWDFPILLLVDDMGSHTSGINRRASTFYTTRTRRAYLYGDVIMISYTYDPLEGDEMTTLPDTITTAQIGYLFDQRIVLVPDLTR